MSAEDDRPANPGVLQSLLNKTHVKTPRILKSAGRTEGSRRVGLAARMRIPAWLRKNALTFATVGGVLGGVAFGFILRGSREERWTAREAMYVSYIGELFLRMLKCLILPLIVSSLISAVGGLDLSLSGKIGLRAVAYYMLTTVMAVILGLILVSTIHPGQGKVDEIHREGGVRNITTADTLMDLVRNIFPPNVVQASVFSYRTKLIPPPEDHSDQHGKPVTSLYELDATPEPPAGVDPSKPSLYDWEIKGSYEEGTNIMGLVMFSFILGITLCKMGDKGKPLYEFFAALAEAMMVITNWVICVSPIGVFFLIAGQLLEMNDFGVIVGQLGMYFVTVLVGIFLHGFIVLPLIYGIATRSLPFRFVLNMTEAVTTAFGTASSSATLPVTYRCLENKNRVDPRISRFVLPIGATINMDGTALYEAVAALFIAQVRGMSLGIGSIIAISITATAASIGAAGIPQAGLVTLVMVLDTVGLPAEDVSLIVAVDWLLDRFRTAINVLGDALGAGIVAHLSQKELDDSTAAHKSRQMPTCAFEEGHDGDDDDEDWKHINNGRKKGGDDAEAGVELTAM